MRSIGALRRGFVLLAVVPLACAALPALAVDRAGFEAQRNEWARTQEQLESTHDDLEAVDARAGEAAAAVAETQQRLRTAQDRLHRLRERLAQATSRLRRAERDNEVAIIALGQEIRALGAMEDAAALYAEELEVQVVAAYMYGGTTARFRGVVDVVLNAGSVTAFTTAYEQLRSSTVSQHSLVADVTTLAELLVSQRARVASMQGETERAAAAAAAERRRIATLTRDQAALVAGIRSDRQMLQQQLAQLEDRRDEYTRGIAALQTASDELFEQLRSYRYVGGAPGAKAMLWPTDGRVTSGFGYRNHPIFATRRLHAGIDIPAPTGQPIFAAADAVVVSAGQRGGYGKAVVLDHGEGLTTVYAHLSSLLVSTGQTVSSGDRLGLVGSTGHSTGPHLHFEIREGGRPVDPLDWY